MIHQYKNNGYNIVMDVNSGSVHIVDDVVYDVIPLAEQLAETSPAAYWDVLYHLDPATKMLYDGKPIFPSRKAFAALFSPESDAESF